MIHARSLKIRYWIAFSLVIVTLWAAIACTVQVLHDRAVDNANITGRNLALSLAANVSSSVQAIDLSILHLRDDWIDDRNGFAGAYALQKKYLERESVAQVGIIDAKGVLAWSSTPGWRPIDYSDREHFINHKASRTDELFISSPMQSRLSKRWVIQFTRAIIDRKGKFAGIVVFSVPPQGLEKMYKEFDIGAGGKIALLRSDGQFLARTQGFAQTVNAAPLSASRPGLKPGDPIAGDYRRVSTIDGVDYLISYRKVRSHPLVIYVLQPVTTVLTPYYEQRKNYLIFGSLATALLFALTYLLISRLIAQQIDAQNKARLAAVVESANDAIITRGTSGRIVTWNAAAERLYGYTAAEAIGRKDFLTPSELQEQVIQFRKMVKAGKVVPPTESVRVARDGRRIDVMISVSPILGQDGRFVGSATITHDITERKRAEAALSKLNEELESRVKDRTADLEAANKELEAFSYSVSHDLRAPLRSILGFGNFLMAENAEQLNAEGKTRLHRILNAGKRMEALIDDLLNLSRVSRQEIRRQEVDLSALAGGVVADLIQRHPEREVQAKVQPEMRVNADAGLLRIVLENLIGNAWKFTAKTDNACIEVGLDIRDGKSIYYIRDNGAGFDMTYAHKLFAPFQRLHSRDEFEGSGIGLSIVNRIVEKHGGKVWVESEKGKGATFYFTC